MAGAGGACYKMTPKSKIYGRIENMFNQKYQEIYGYNTAGIGAYAGVKINLVRMAAPGIS